MLTRICLVCDEINKLADCTLNIIRTKKLIFKLIYVPLVRLYRHTSTLYVVRFRAIYRVIVLFNVS